MEKARWRQGGQRGEKAKKRSREPRWGLENDCGKKLVEDNGYSLGCRIMKRKASSCWQQQREGKTQAEKVGRLSFFGGLSNS